MKIVLITYNEALNTEVEKILQANTVEGFTRWTKVYGKGKASGPHLGTHVWPKANNVLMTLTDDQTAKKMLDHVRELRKTLAKEGIKAFLLPCEEIT